MSFSLVLIIKAQRAREWFMKVQIKLSSYEASRLTRHEIIVVGPGILVLNYQFLDVFALR